MRSLPAPSAGEGRFPVRVRCEGERAVHPRARRSVARDAGCMWCNRLAMGAEGSIRRCFSLRAVAGMPSCLHAGKNVDIAKKNRAVEGCVVRLRQFKTVVISIHAATPPSLSPDRVHRLFLASRVARCELRARGRVLSPGRLARFFAYHFEKIGDHVEPRIA